MQDTATAFPSQAPPKLDPESKVERLRTPLKSPLKRGRSRRETPATYLVHRLWPILRPHLARFGSHCMAYSTLQTGLDYFIDQRLGYIAHLSFRHRLMHRKPVRMVVSEPICAPENRERMFRKFLDEYSDVLFVHVGVESAAILAGLGLQVYQVGVEREVDLAEFSLSARASTPLRAWRNRARDQGVKVLESPISRMDHQDVRALCDEWKGLKRRREISFLNRPLMLADEPDTRFFWAMQDNRPVGLAGFDPIYEHGRVIGYHRGFDRTTATAPAHTSDLLTIAAAQAFQDEGKQRLSLGLSPLAELAPGYNLKGLLLGAARLTARCGERFYAFKAADDHKADFGAKARPAYIAGTTGPLAVATAAARACGIL